VVCPALQTRIQITVAYNYRTIKMIQPEQDAMQLIWNQCCAAEINASTIQAVETSDGENSLRGALVDSPEVTEDM
jgi:hypothetical protein